MSLSHAEHSPLGPYTCEALRRIVGGTCEGSASAHRRIGAIYYDTRRIIDGEEGIFVALRSRRDGHQFLLAAFEAGVRMFLVSDRSAVRRLPAYVQTQSTFVVVPDTLKALHQWARHHRCAFQGPVIGITGSNGKTIVKEWLYHLVGPFISTHRSPGSYNSQLGVALSILGIRPFHRQALIEAGISRPGEMAALASLIHPTGGIFTTLGDAHDVHFTDRQHKLEEKLRLFRGVQWLVFRGDRPYSETIRRFCHRHRIRPVEWRIEGESTYRISRKTDAHGTHLTIHHNSETARLRLPFTSSHAIENAAHAVVTAHQLGLSFEQIGSLTASLPWIRMRLEVETARHESLLINDAYNADAASLKAAVEFIRPYARTYQPALILSDFEETAPPPDQLRNLLGTVPWERIYHVGTEPHLAGLYPYHTISVPDVETLIQRLKNESLSHRVWLVKGARRARLERVVAWLRHQSHPTRLEVNLAALAHNFFLYQSLLPPHTGIILMVKAFAYGTGLTQLSHFLNDLPARWVAVAYIDEGVRLREAGLRHRIMVMNPEGGDLTQLMAHRLEPVVFSMHLWDHLHQSGYEGPIHIKLDTGMRRVGFEAHHLDELIRRLRHTPRWEVASVFSHLAAAEDPRHDAFTRTQLAQFEGWTARLQRRLGIRFTRHILNSAGTARFAPEHAYEAVRLGIGLLGVDPAGVLTHRLEPALTFKTYVLDVRHLPAGATVGYGRAGRMTRSGRVAVLGAGYGDGYRRALSGGQGKVNINGMLYPTIGNVCMDVTLVEVGEGDVRPGDEVILFGEMPSLEEVARWAGTIPYELIVGIPPRVRRVYFLESG